MAGGDAGSGWRWDVALSFAGAQRDYVGQVAASLKTRGVRCFYDADEQIDLWGKYLAEELPAIYGEQAAAAVVFMSAEYAARDWTRLERRAALNRAVRQRREYVLPARFDDTPLPGLLSDLVAVDLHGRPSEQFADMIAAKLAALGITGPDPDRGEVLSSGKGVTRPPGAVRVAEADLRRLGVHAAISVPGVPDEIPPEYVPRDADAAGHGIRAKVAAAARRGGFILLTGGSSVGKTRCAAEAVKALLPDWWLIHPDGPAQVAALAAAPAPRTVVWLDELQRYLDGDNGLTGGTIRALLNAPVPMVIIATLWPDRYAAYTAVPVPSAPDLRAREREVLELAAVIRIRPQFSAAEQARVRDAAARDPRLAAAVKAAGYGLTQTLAAAPQLVARWEDAQDADPYAWAVLTAALDAARVGARAPLTARFLRAAASGYCTPAQQAEAPDTWFEQALAYATTKLHGAAAAMTPTGAGMGQTAGYAAADYLLQHATRERRGARVPASTWDALLSHVRDAGEATRLASSAAGRLLYRYAIPLYRYAAEAGDQEAAWWLDEVLNSREDPEVLRARADGGDMDALLALAGVLAAQGDLDGLRALAAVGDQDAAGRLAGLLDPDGLRARADTGDSHAASRLAGLLADRGNLDELQARAEARDGHGASRLAEVLADRADLEGLRARADAGDEEAARRLSSVLRDRGDLDGLRARADTGDGYATLQLVDMLAGRGDLDGLRARADVGDLHAARRLDRLLRDRGDLDGLRARADVGDLHAAVHLAEVLGDRADLDGLRARAELHASWRLAGLLADRGDLDGLRARADAGDLSAASRLDGLLRERGDLDGLRARADAGDNDAARRLAGLLASREDLDGLRARADAGDNDAIIRLAEVLASRGDLDGLRARADTRDYHATRWLVGILADRGDHEGLRARADAGDTYAAMRLVEILASRGDLDGLQVRADADDLHSALRLARVLASRGDLDGLRIRADAGDTYAAMRLADVLTSRDDLEGLRARAADDDYAARRLADVLGRRGNLDQALKILRAQADAGNGDVSQVARLLRQQGHGDEAERLRQFGLNPDGSIASE